MWWLRRYRAKHYLANSIWLLPSLGVLTAMCAVRLLHNADATATTPEPGAAETVRALLGTLAASMFTFVVFVSSALMLSVQLASAQLTPRIISFLFRDPTTKLALTLFAFTYTLSLAALVRVTDAVPLLAVKAAAYGSLLSLVVFLYLIDHVCKSFRPSGALSAVAAQGAAEIAAVYPEPLSAAPTAAAIDLPALTSTTPPHVVRADQTGVVLAVNESALVNFAVRHQRLVELVPHVGSFIASGDPLLRIYSGTSAPRAHEEPLAACVAVGVERTMQQDPASAFRVIVDVACKALSKAINDPTTAVLAIDQLNQLLHLAGHRRLGDAVVRDGAGQPRLFLRRPTWDDFVHLAVTEIRQYGQESIQVTRRLRAMLEGLIETLPAERHELLQRELDVLKRAAERGFDDPEDKELAKTPDTQGVGGHAPPPSAASASGPGDRTVPGSVSPAHGHATSPPVRP